MRHSGCTLIRLRGISPLTPYDNPCRGYLQCNFHIPLALVLQLLLRLNIPTIGSCPSSTSDMLDKHSDRRKAILRNTFDAASDHRTECGRECAMCGYRLNKQDNSIGRRSRHTYDLQPAAALVDTCCTPYSGKIDPGLRLGKYRNLHSDTDFDLRHRTDYIPDRCTVQNALHTFRIALALAAASCIRCKSIP